MGKEKHNPSYSLKVYYYYHNKRKCISTCKDHIKKKSGWKQDMISIEVQTLSKGSFTLTLNFTITLYRF